MSLADFLREHHAALVAGWIREAESAYPLQTAGFLRSRQDPFANPVGQRIRDAAEALFSVLTADAEQETALVPLTEFLRIRAVQDGAPGEALTLVYACTRLVRAALAERRVPMTLALYEELDLIRARVDNLALLSFDIYARCRENLFTLRLRDMRRRAVMLQRMAQIGDADDMTELHSREENHEDA